MKTNNAVMPYFLEHPEWVEIIDLEDGGWDYKLKPGAPQDIVDSYNEYKNNGISDEDQYPEDEEAKIKDLFGV